MNLIDELVRDGWLKTPRIISAFRKIKREDFLTEDQKSLAELNEALPIGYSQTISQPLVVAFMLELLQPEPGDKILDVGSGSGWTTALLAEIVSQKERPPKTKSIQAGPPHSKGVGGGRIIALELIPELKEFGEDNIKRYNYINNGVVEFICADGSKGYEKEASYDKILVSASVQDEIPKAWKEQLKIGGRIVTPIKNSIWLIVKKDDNNFEEKECPGFVFVPLIEKNL